MGQLGLPHRIFLLGARASSPPVAAPVRYPPLSGPTRPSRLAQEVLQGNVMTFVNQVAEIVHGIVDQFSGAVNRNAGETFLVIWRTEEAPQEDVTKLAEMSVAALARILASVHSSPVLAAYRHHPGLQQRLRGDCRVDLSFGLHHGWTIEGAVGSEFKIDASYVSPNVNIALSLEQAASQIYGVSVLVSDVVVRLCGLEMASQLRLVDEVIVSGSKRPLQLFVLDLDTSALTVGLGTCIRLQGSEFGALYFRESGLFKRVVKDKPLQEGSSGAAWFSLRPC